MTNHNPSPGNAPGLSRRALLAAIPAAGIAMTATPLPAETASDDTPILRLFHQHRAMMEAAGKHLCAATGKAEDEELDRLFYRPARRIEAEMMAMPSTCAADFAAKAIVDTCEGELLSDWQTGTIWKEARALTGESDPAATMPAPPAEALADPHREWLNEWSANHDAFDAAPDCESDLSPHLARANEIEKLICTTTAKTRDGLIAQMEWATHESGLSAYMGNFADNLDGTFLKTVLAGLRSA